jgi:hypothetical protein
VSEERLGNRAATCRAYYVHPADTEAYLTGDLLSVTTRETSVTEETLAPAEAAVLRIVKRYLFDLVAASGNAA